MDLMDMKGKAVLISGGTSGIGLSAAGLLLKAGAMVALLGRSEKRGQEALAKLGECFPKDKIIYIRGDVASRTDCRQAVEEIISSFGRLDVLVNSAGIYREGALEEITEEELDAILSVNVKGTFWLVQAGAQEIEGQCGECGFRRRCTWQLFLLSLLCQQGGSGALYQSHGIGTGFLWGAGECHCPWGYPDPLDGKSAGRGA